MTTHPHRVAGAVADDLDNRWQPTPESVQLAVAMLAVADTSAHTVALIPMYLPGKGFGIWTAGQDVRTVPHAVLLLDERAPATRANRWAVEEVAKAHAQRAGVEVGTYGHAVVWPDGEWAVFEDGPL